MYNATMREPGVSKQLDPCVQGTDAVAFVVNDHGFHWNTAVIDIGKRMVGRYDSGGWSYDPFQVVVRNTELGLISLVQLVSQQAHGPSSSLGSTFQKRH